MADWSIQEANAAAELYRQYYPRARLFALRRLRDRHAAHDLAQDAVLLAIAKLRAGEIREPERVGAFMLGICRMLLRNHVRDERRHQELLELYAEATSEPEHGAADALATDHARLAHCLQQLSERARTVTVLTYYAERSAEEVGRELDLTPGNVRVIRHRALASLLSCLEGK